MRFLVALLVCFFRAVITSRGSLAPENLALRQQLATGDNAANRGLSTARNAIAPERIARQIRDQAPAGLDGHPAIFGVAISRFLATVSRRWGLPHVLVTVGGVPVSPAAGVYVTPGGFNDYPFTFNAPGGSQEIRVIFDNDAYGWFGDRNLIVQTVTMSCP